MEEMKYACPPSYKGCSKLFPGWMHSVSLNRRSLRRLIRLGTQRFLDKREPLEVMSLQDKKASLFGKSSDTRTASSSSSSSSVQKSIAPPPPPPVVSKAMPPPVAGGSSLSLGLGLSEAAKKKKLEEGQALSAKAKKYLETSVFKWKPDHLAAAPLMEKAAECYRAASDLHIAKQLFVEASDSHEACNAFAGSALALVKGTMDFKLYALYNLFDLTLFLLVFLPYILSSKRLIAVKREENSSNVLTCFKRQPTHGVCTETLRRLLIPI